MVPGVRVRAREQLAEVRPPGGIADEEGDVTPVGQRHLRAVDRAQAGRPRRLRELHRAGDRVMVGQCERGVPAAHRGRHELLGLGRPVEEREGRVTVELHVGHEHMFARRVDGRRRLRRRPDGRP